MIPCDTCGHENRDGAKFCEACAASLVAADSVAEVRKTVTVVFCDVAGSTAMGEALDPESVRRVMERYFNAMRARIEHHGGTVEKFIGDAVMAIFGVPASMKTMRFVRSEPHLRCEGPGRLERRSCSSIWDDPQMPDRGEHRRGRGWCG